MAPAWRLWLAAVALMAFPGMSSIVAADAASNPEVVCGSVIKLESDAHKGFRLVTQDVAYGGGSGQMSVTTNPESDEDGYWVVRGAPGCRWWCP
ncbi:unnamed protein product [Pedinophyceae sp. YPF-701]|nr:unnamed protein product [Pedinophyceae sp. YPF-701]